jgi:hypothetical protein
MSPSRFACQIKTSVRIVAEADINEDKVNSGRDIQRSKCLYGGGGSYGLMTLLSKIGLRKDTDLFFVLYD